jgi:hypothetical protein
VSNTTCPLVYVHRGCPEYLEYSLRTTIANNPNRDIFLIGDDTNQALQSRLRLNWYAIEEVALKSPHYSSLCANYKHYSINDLDYERFCFLRWPLVTQLCSIIESDSIIYVDSDNVLLCDIDDIWEGNTLSPNGLIQPISPLATWLMGIGKHTLTAFSEFLALLYSSTDSAVQDLALHSPRLIEPYLQILRGKLHFSDMYALFIFTHLHFIS